MFDVESLRLLRSRTTVFDFVVVAAVVIVAQTVGLIAASGVGIGLAILLFIGIVALTIVFGPDYLKPRGLPVADALTIGEARAAILAAFRG